MVRWKSLGRDPQSGAYGASAKLAFCLAGLAASAWLPAPASAQTSASAQSQVLIQRPTTIHRRYDMDFGQIVNSSTPGTVVLTPTPAGSCTATPNLVRSGPCRPAVFSGYSSPLSFLRVERPPGNVLTLTGPGGATMPVTNLTYASDAALVQIFSDATYVRFLVVDSNGLYELRIGGTLNVAAHQAPGVYSGTIEVLLNFN